MQLDATTATLGLMVVAQLCAIVWGAARWASAVDELRRTLAETNGWLRKVDGRVGRHETRIAVLEAKERPE